VLKSRISAVFLIVCGLAVRPVPALDRPPAARPLEEAGKPLLRRSLLLLERGIGQRDLVRLAEMLPRDQRVLVRWGRPLHRDGLLTGRQVLLLFEELFNGFRTVRFSIEAGSLQEASGVYHCMGRWTLRPPGGQSEAIELHFSLRYDDGAWTIREVRQTR
jgi:hypothetical protein